MRRKEHLEFTVEEVYNMMYAIALYAEGTSTLQFNKAISATIAKVQGLVKVERGENGKWSGRITRPFTFLGQR